jgi:hypothetical protein
MKVALLEDILWLLRGQELFITRVASFAGPMRENALPNHLLKLETDTT